MPRAKQPDFYIAISSGVLKINGKLERYIAGQTVVARDSALYRAHPDKFKPVQRPAIEKATAAPGENR